MIKIKIGLIDVDGHNFPNLPLMRISACHKARGDTVEWYEPLKGTYDRVYVMIYNKEASRNNRLLQRWVNNKFIFRACEKYEDYNPKLG